ncbi:hypothetical protein BJI67_12890 [Acidihalobacter aeolianus]|uniref:Type IV secretion system coupling protein TraD DNA-binding domain-containing protein n=1 Tax=Acidihalobacter aeolianus TaxID=2792603 RepID=A0A1D8KA28_9GAMM|nr:type IV secretion system DNA-binding domain-containing protein [Acidihalobacter aeolianus]AOV17828.1 hypothetical protein BJI67_12890 [Acidihalobacter aeolianus]
MLWPWQKPSKPSPRADRIQIGGVPVPPSLEALHFLIAGSTGTGKSQAISANLDIIRGRGDRVIMADPGGQYMARWWQPGDTILAPLDARSVRWSPFSEMRGQADADRVAKSIIPDVEGGGDAAEWARHSQGLVGAVLERLLESGGATNERFVKLLTVAKSGEIEAIVEGLPAQTLFDTGAAKMLSSVRGIIGSALPAYRFLPPDAGADAWSIRRWIEGGSGWLWLPYRDSQRAAMAPLISAWLGEVVSAILDLEPSRERRIWLVLDEVALLGKVQALSDALTNGRKYGLRAVLGLQSVAQLRQAYGREGATVLLSCLSSQLILRSPDPETADTMSRALGEHQISREHSSHGPSGSSTSEHVVIERAVLPSELQCLPDRVGYLKLAGDYPLAKVSIGITHKEPAVPSFIPRDSSPKSPSPVVKEAPPPTVEGDEKIVAPVLSLELVPSTCAGENLRGLLTANDWQKLQKRTAAEAGGVCEICGGTGDKWPVETHEVWGYDDDARVQKLERLQALCPLCHSTKHVGHAAQKGREQEAMKRLAELNQWDAETARKYVDQEMKICRERSRHQWVQDLAVLTEKYDLKIPRKENEDD